MLTITSYIVINLHIISGKIFKYYVKWYFISRSIWEIGSMYLICNVRHTVCVNILYIITMLAITSHIVINLHIISGKILNNMLSDILWVSEYGRLDQSI